LAKLDHPNILKYYGSYDVEGGRILVLESLPDRDLIDSVEDWEIGDEARTLRLIRDVCNALHYCHNEAEIAHRDVKPDNIVETGGRFVLLDFGHSISLCPAESCETPKNTPVSDSETEQEEDDIGTMGYRPPEYISQGVYGPAGDVWALGVTALVMYSHTPPSLTEEGTLCEGELDRLLEGMSVEGCRVLRRMLEPDPSLRLTTAELVKDPWLLPAEDQNVNSPPGRKTAVCA
jgi:serine/threonine protein kinase